MSVAVQTARQAWLDGLGEWSWPGRRGAVAELAPPPWVPSFPPRAEPAVAVAPGAEASIAASAAIAAPSRVARLAPDWGLARRLAIGAVLSALAAICISLAFAGPGRLFAGIRQDAGSRSVVLARGVAAAPNSAATPQTSGTAAQASLAPTLVAVSHDAAGSSIDQATYTSAALHQRGSFVVYLPPGFAGASERYPVLYLLHGYGQSDRSFLQIGLQDKLDRLIARRTIRPLIAVMIQGGSGLNNWRDQGLRGYESYVLEVQELVDRALPTIADRSGRAIAGYSMGGYGAANIALSHLDRFSVVESWLGFFDGLQTELVGDRPTLARLGLRAFLYGAESDAIANPAEDASFAAALRAAGANADSAVYDGDHSLETLHTHLTHMLTFAGEGMARAR